MDTNTFLLLVFGLLAVLVGFMIPVLIQLMKMIRSLRALIDDTDSSIKPLLNEVGETLHRVNSIVGTVDESVKGIRSIFTFFGTTMKVASGYFRKGAKPEEE